ncbi:hypothetical protein WN944_002331 [Citrus x changshan-huyou]|uniref:Uncharacterized protein n=1 Tax=Citrus x changshan-huyou TaxID=2935761 RepID=A0AAP0MGD1_9ROSI
MKFWRRTKQQNVHVAICIHSKLNSLNRAIYSSWMESKILKSCCKMAGICKMEDETLKESGGIAATGLHRSGVVLLVLLRFG